jgi:hypothetical protein
MADSSIATKDIEDWIRGNTLKKVFRQSFSKKKLHLHYGGVYECDAVSADESIVCFISTSVRKTVSGKTASAKLSKIRADAYWALSLQTEPGKIIFAFTDESMVDLFKQEQRNGRFPPDYEILHAKLPPELIKILALSKMDAVREMIKIKR